MLREVWTLVCLASLWFCLVQNDETLLPVFALPVIASCLFTLAERALGAALGAACAQVLSSSQA